MAINLDVSIDVKAATKRLNFIQRKQIPFATSLAINKTLQNVQKAEQVQMQRKLDRPTPATVKAVRIDPSKKRILPISGSVFVLPWAADYLTYQIHGGTRHLTTAVPTNNARLNKYGNIPARKKGLIKRKSDFIAKINGTAGVWRKVGRGQHSRIKLVHAFIKNPRYPAGRWPFYKIAQGVVNSKFRRNFDKALASALRTAR